MCHLLFQLSLFKEQWQFSMPALHSDFVERVIYLTGSAAAVLSRRATLKQIIRTMKASGVLTAEDGPQQGGKGVGAGEGDKCGAGGSGLAREGTPSRTSVSWMHDG